MKLEGRRSCDHHVVKKFREIFIPKIGDVLGVDFFASNKSLLEVGAGNGHFSAGFLDIFDVTCIDLNRKLLSDNPASKRIEGDFLKKRFSSKYDVVFFGNSLHHIESFSDAASKAVELSEEYVILVEPNPLNPLIFLHGLFARGERGELSLGKRRVMDLFSELEMIHYGAYSLFTPNFSAEWFCNVFSWKGKIPILGFYQFFVFRKK